MVFWQFIHMNYETTVPIRVPVEIHTAAKAAAARWRLSLKEFAAVAIRNHTVKMNEELDRGEVRVSETSSTH
jgi:hypothetical protein